MAMQEHYVREKEALHHEKRHIEVRFDQTGLKSHFHFQQCLLHKSSILTDIKSKLLDE